jgi:iron complex transport system permease protein
VATQGEILAAIRLRPGRLARVRARPVVLGAVGVIALFFALVLGVGLGSVAVPPGETLAILGHRLLGLDLPVTWTPATETIVMELRLPRVLSAMVVGVGLAVAGATFQGLLRNPLADPYVLGTASGAALGAALAVLIPVRMLVLEFGLLNGLAFIGALAAVWVVYSLARTSPLSPLTGLLLTGYAVGSLLAAGCHGDVPLGRGPAPDLQLPPRGLRGPVDAAAVASSLIFFGTVAIAVRSRSLNGLLLGEAGAHLGVDVRRERAILLGLASLVTAAGVAVAGLIGFVGLVVPHLVRLVVGPDARLVLPLSALGGALLLSSADLVARMLGEIPVGVVTAVIGAPFFLLLLRRARTGYEL